MKTLGELPGAMFKITCEMWCGMIFGNVMVFSCIARNSRGFKSNFVGITQFTRSTVILVKCTVINVICVLPTDKNEREQLI